VPDIAIPSMNTPTIKRFRHAVAFVDTDSEEDVEIDTLATLTSVGMSVTHQAFPSPTKRLKTNHSRQAESAPHNNTVIPFEDATAVNTAHVEENPAEEKRKNQVRFS
jgi:hypothetical protein